MDKQLFKQWFEKFFLKACGPERPVLLLLDNHDSHLSYVLDMTMRNEVVICSIEYLYHLTYKSNCDLVINATLNVMLCES